MLAVISPAKKLDLEPLDRALPYSQPALLDQTETLMKTTRRLSAKKLSAMMSISDALATLNRQRFQDFATPFSPDNAKPAALMFAGDTYMGLDAGSLTDADLDYAQTHLAILSGLYGVLRPLDLMQAYRLEMGTRLRTRRGETLYAFWGDRIAKQLNAMTAEHTDRTVVNCASNEYFKAVRAKRLKAPVVTPAFKEDKGGGDLKTISFLAKKARGMMARFVVEQRVDRPEGLKDFAGADYRFQPSLSDASTLVFTRPWRSAASAA